MKIRFLAAANAELTDTVTYDDELLPGLGAEFAAEVRGGLDRIKEYPKAWQLLGRRVRRYRLNRYPFGLVYAPLELEIEPRVLERAVEADSSVFPCLSKITAPRGRRPTRKDFR